MFRVTPMTCPIWVLVPMALASIVSDLGPREKPGVLPSINTPISTKAPRIRLCVFGSPLLICHISFLLSAENTQKLGLTSRRASKRASLLGRVASWRTAYELAYRKHHSIGGLRLRQFVILRVFDLRLIRRSRLLSLIVDCRSLESHCC